MLGDLDKLIVAIGFKKLLKVQKIAISGHTDRHRLFHSCDKFSAFCVSSL